MQPAVWKKKQLHSGVEFVDEVPKNLVGQILRSEMAKNLLEL